MADDASPAVVAGSYVKLSTLTDGTCRIVIDVEPRDAQAAFALFGKPGAPVALALISNEAAVEHDRKAQAQPPAEPLERKPLSLASKVALTCTERSFARFLSQPRFDSARTTAMSVVGERASTDPDRHGYFEPADAVAELVRRICGVESRSEIRPGSEAAERWATLEADYLDWQRRSAA